jgi:hypothetical protein
MTITSDEPGRTVLDAVLDIHRVRQYFNVILRARSAAAAVRKDMGFLDALRRGLVPTPFDHLPGRSSAPSTARRRGRSRAESA